MIGQLVRMAVVFVVSVFGVSCVVSAPKGQIDSSPSTEIQDIRVIEKNGKMTIEVEGEEPMIYTTFHLSDPDRLVVDMAGVSLGRFHEEILMETGPVRAIRPAEGGGDNVARLEFVLADSAEAEVKTEGLSLVVEVVESEAMTSRFTSSEKDAVVPPNEIVAPPLPASAANTPVEGLAPPPAVLAAGDLPGASKADPSGSPEGATPQGMEKSSVKPSEAAAPSGEMGAESASKNIEPPPLVPLSDAPEPEDASETVDASPLEGGPQGPEETALNAEAPPVLNSGTKAKPGTAQGAAPVQKMKPLPKATSVQSIQWDRDQDLQLVVTSDGVLSPSVFFVDQGRLVIDLPGVKAENGRTQIPSEAVHIKQIRVGQHENKLRLVVDLNGPIDYDWKLEENQLKVRLTAQTKTAAQARQAAPLDPTEGMAAEKGLKKSDQKAQDRSASGILPPLPPVLPAGKTANLAEIENGAEAENAPETARDEMPMDEMAMEKREAASAKDDAVKKKTFLKRLRQKKGNVSFKPIATPKNQEQEISQPSLVQEYVGRKISLDFQDADITNVIRLIAEVSGLNFVMADDVNGKVTLKLNDVPWDQALDIMLSMHNLGKVREGNIIRVATLANLSKQRDEEARAKETKIKAEDLLTRVIYVNYAKADDMMTLLTKLLSPRGEIMVDKRTNALIVKDIKDNLTEVERLAVRMDTKTPQVLIEARIAEVKPVFLRSLGIKWGAGYNATAGGNLIGIGNSTLASPINAGVPDFAVNLPASTSLGGIGFTFGRFTQNPFTLDLRLSAGETQALTRVVSTPKVMVLDNHEALIEQGESVPFSTVSQEGTQVQFIDANLTLKVTPHISPDGGILLDVHLSKNEAGPVSPGAPGPPIFKKEVTTNVLLMDGETMVIGGIYETTKTDSESGIPWLKELPLVGWLFKNKETREDTSELLVFLTPKVMD